CSVGTAGLRHVGASAAAFAAQSFGTEAHEIDRADARREIVRHTDHERCFAVCNGDECPHAGLDLGLVIVGETLEILGSHTLNDAHVDRDATYRSCLRIDPYANWPRLSGS